MSNNNNNETLTESKEMSTDADNNKRKLSELSKINDDMKEPPKKKLKIDNIDIKKLIKNEDKIDEDMDMDMNMTMECKNNNNGILNDNETKLKDQIEYYFGEYNLTFDHFIQKELKKYDGWFKMSVLLGFKRVKMFTDDLKKIANVIKTSDKFIIKDDDEYMFKLKVPVKYDENKLKDLLDRTIFAKGHHPRSSIDKLLKFWNNKGKVIGIKMLKQRIKIGVKMDNKNSNTKNVFIGDVYVTFANKEMSDKILNVGLFNHENRMITIGKYPDYKNEVEWRIKETYHDFINDSVILIKNIPNLCTKHDIKIWLNDAQYEHKRLTKKFIVNINCAFIYKIKDINSCFIRINTRVSDNINKIILKLNKTKFMNIQPKAIKLKNDYAKKIWNKVAVKDMKLIEKITTKEIKNDETLAINDENSTSNGINNENISIKNESKKIIKPETSSKN